MKQIYFFDIDNTLCITERDDYKNAKPIKKRIAKVNQLFDEGHTVNIWTARGAVSSINWLPFTHEQLKGWGVKFTKLYQKPYGDFLVDDKAVNDKDFFNDKTN